MQCKKCGFENETTEAYCRLCGARLSFTVGRAESSLLDRATTDSARQMEDELRRFLVLSVCIFLLLVTLKFMYGRGTWTIAYVVPAASVTGEYARLHYIYEPPNIAEEKLDLPVVK